MAGRKPGTGQISAGVARAPLACFDEDLRGGERHLDGAGIVAVDDVVIDRVMEGL